MNLATHILFDPNVMDLSLLTLQRAALELLGENNPSV